MLFHGTFGLVLFAFSRHDYLPFFIGLPVFLASFLAAALPFGVYANSFFPTIGMIVPFVS